jgi:hypothetical protein
MRYNFAFAASEAGRCQILGQPRMYMGAVSILASSQRNACGEPTSSFTDAASCGQASTCSACMHPTPLHTPGKLDLFPAQNAACMATQRIRVHAATLRSLTICGEGYPLLAHPPPRHSRRERQWDMWQGTLVRGHPCHGVFCRSPPSPVRHS